MMSNGRGIPLSLTELHIAPPPPSPHSTPTPHREQRKHWTANHLPLDAWGRPSTKTQPSSPSTQIRNFPSEKKCNILEGSEIGEPNFGCENFL